MQGPCRCLGFEPDQLVCVLPRRTWGTCNKSLLRIICKYNSTLTPFQCTETWFVHKNGSRNGITETNPLDSPFLPQHPVNYSTGYHVDYPKALTVETCHGCTVPNDALKKPFNPCLDMSRTIYLQHFSSMKNPLSVSACSVQFYLRRCSSL